MSLLQLKQIGKIYVSDGNVAVGIRGIDLSFDRGEFVAVTGSQNYNFHRNLHSTLSVRF